MFKKDQKEKKKQEILTHLLDDPTQGTSILSKKTGMNRRTVYQIQKDYENDQTIWGYTTVVDEQKLGRAVYLLKFKTRPFTKTFADLIHRRLTVDIATTEKFGIRLLDIEYLSGEYDVLIKFSAPTHDIARKYFEILRSVYKDHFLDDPHMSIVNMSFIKNGKVHPRLKQTLQALVPPPLEKKATR